MVVAVTWLEQVIGWDTKGAVVDQKADTLCELCLVVGSKSRYTGCLAMDLSDCHCTPASVE